MRHLVRMDARIANESRGKLVIVCVEIDLERADIGKIWFKNHWFYVEYKGLQTLHLLYKKVSFMVTLPEVLAQQ